MTSGTGRWHDVRLPAQPACFGDLTGRLQRPWMKAMASARVRGSSRNRPRTAEVTVSGARLADAPHRHAQVLGLDDHEHAPGLEDLLDGVGDLRGEPLLHLGPAGVAVDQAGQLGQAR